MPHHVFLLLLVSFLMLCLLLLCSLCWPHPGPAQSRAAAKMRTTLHRLLKPRCPDDGPACRLASTPSSGGGPAPGMSRPWCEVKSRRGAPKRIDTQGFACPNQQCLYFGISDAHIHALVGDGKHGQAERIGDLSRSCLPHHVPCSTPHALVPFENPFAPDRHSADLALAEGLDPSAAERVAGLSTGHHSQPFCPVRASTRKLCTSAASAISSSRTCSWMNCEPGSAAPNRCVLLWLVIDPCTRASSRPPSGPPHAKRRAYSHPLPTTPLGRLSVCRSSPVMASISPFMPSQRILGSGEKWDVKVGRCVSGR